MGAPAEYPDYGVRAWYMPRLRGNEFIPTWDRLVVPLRTPDSKDVGNTEDWGYYDLYIPEDWTDDQATGFTEDPAVNDGNPQGMVWDNISHTGPSGETYTMSVNRYSGAIIDKFGFDDGVTSFTNFINHRDYGRQMQSAAFLNHPTDANDEWNPNQGGPVQLQSTITEGPFYGLPVTKYQKEAQPDGSYVLETESIPAEFDNAGASAGTSKFCIMLHPWFRIRQRWELASKGFVGVTRIESTFINGYSEPINAANTSPSEFSFAAHTVADVNGVHFVSISGDGASDTVTEKTGDTLSGAVDYDDEEVRYRITRGQATYVLDSGGGEVDVAATTFEANATNFPFTGICFDYGTLGGSVLFLSRFRDELSPTADLTSRRRYTNRNYRHTYRIGDGTTTGTGSKIANTAIYTANCQIVDGLREQTTTNTSFSAYPITKGRAKLVTYMIIGADAAECVSRAKAYIAAGHAEDN